VIAVSGGAFGVAALLRRNDAEAACAAGDCVQGESQNRQARGFAWVSNIGIGVGTATAVIALVMLFSKSHMSKAAQAETRKATLFRPLQIPF
jgi:hypothetical protein